MQCQYSRRPSQILLELRKLHTLSVEAQREVRYFGRLALVPDPVPLRNESSYHGPPHSYSPSDAKSKILLQIRPCVCEEEMTRLTSLCSEIETALRSSSSGTSLDI